MGARASADKAVGGSGGWREERSRDNCRISFSPAVVHTDVRTKCQRGDVAGVSLFGGDNLLDHSRSKPEAVNDRSQSPYQNNESRANRSRPSQ